jgi:hypothetical protein
MCPQAILTIGLCDSVLIFVTVGKTVRVATTGGKTDHGLIEETLKERRGGAEARRSAFLLPHHLLSCLKTLAVLALTANSMH